MVTSARSSTIGEEPIFFVLTYYLNRVIILWSRTRAREFNYFKKGERPCEFKQTEPCGLLPPKPLDAILSPAILPYPQICVPLRHRLSDRVIRREIVVPEGITRRDFLYYYPAEKNKSTSIPFRNAKRVNNSRRAAGVKNESDTKIQKISFPGKRRGVQ